MKIYFAGTTLTEERERGFFWNAKDFFLFITTSQKEWLIKTGGSELKIYLAGEPGGNKRERLSVFLSIWNSLNRLQSFYYLEQLKTEVQFYENISGNLD